MSFGGLYIPMSGIYANKKSLDTIAHNIANVNNDNYVRQSVIHAESSYTKGVEVRFSKGTGVRVQEVRQIRDEFLDIKLRREMASFGYHNTKSQILGEVEAIFNEGTNEGLQNVMDDFWDSWAEVLKEPDNLTMRSLLHESSVSFTTTVNHMAIQLDDLQHSLNKEMLNKTNEVNSLLKYIGDLNQEIKMAEAYGNKISANDYRDERNAALDRLSELIPITHYEDKNGEEVVSLQGKDLVHGDYLSPLDIKLNDKGLGEIHWSDTGNKIDLKGMGELGGYIDARDTSVVEYRDRLNMFVGEIASAVNVIHKSGKDLDGNQGLDFFIISNPEDAAASIKINPELEDLKKMALSESGDVGDGKIAKDILDLRDGLIFTQYKSDDEKYKYSDWDNLDDFKSFLEGNKNGSTSDGFYRDITLQLGLEREISRDMTINQILLIRQIDERRSEISKVSLDEEMTNMLKHQHSYIANSRVVNAVDEMIDQVVNRMGIVGR